MGTDGDAGRVDSTVKISLSDGSVWFYKITEVGERNHKVAYELIMTEPAIDVSNFVGEFALSAVTDSKSTFLEWSTEYTNDVSADFISDIIWKKRDMFDAMKEVLS